MGLLQESTRPKPDDGRHPSAACHRRREESANSQLEEYNVPPHQINNPNRTKQTKRQPKAPE